MKLFLVFLALGLGGCSLLGRLSEPETQASLSAGLDTAGKATTAAGVATGQPLIVLAGSILLALSGVFKKGVGDESQAPASVA